MVYEAITEGVRVEVSPQFISRETNGTMLFHVYAYTVKIENLRNHPCQLISRHWIIRDGTGHDEHVVGEGVIGKQPIIYPGKRYVYRSGCPLQTPTGSMRGWYQMADCGPENEEFDIRIPVFFLRPEGHGFQSKQHAT